MIQLNSIQDEIVKMSILDARGREGGIMGMTM